MSPALLHSMYPEAVGQGITLCSTEAPLPLLQHALMHNTDGFHLAVSHLKQLLKQLSVRLQGRQSRMSLLQALVPAVFPDFTVERRTEILLTLARSSGLNEDDVVAEKVARDPNLEIAMRCLEECDGEVARDFGDIKNAISKRRDGIPPRPRPSVLPNTQQAKRKKAKVAETSSHRKDESDSDSDDGDTSDDAETVEGEEDMKEDTEEEEAQEEEEEEEEEVEEDILEDPYPSDDEAGECLDLAGAVGSGSASTSAFVPEGGWVCWWQCSTCNARQCQCQCVCSRR